MYIDDHLIVSYKIMLYIYIVDLKSKMANITRRSLTYGEIPPNLLLETNTLYIKRKLDCNVFRTYVII